MLGKDYADMTLRDLGVSRTKREEITRVFEPENCVQTFHR